MICSDSRSNVFLMRDAAQLVFDVTHLHNARVFTALTCEALIRHRSANVTIIQLFLLRLTNWKKDLNTLKGSWNRKEVMTP